MKEFNKIYHKILEDLEITNLYNVSSELIQEEKNAYINYIHKKHPTRTICPYSIEDDIFCEQTYFQEWDVNESCILVIKEIIDQILKKYKQTQDFYDLTFTISIKEFLSKIDYTTLSNFKNFHKFLDILKHNAIGNIIFSVGQSKDSFFKPPLIFGYEPTNELIQDSYYLYITDLTKECLTWKEANKLIIENLCNLDNFGTINISVTALQHGEDYLKNSIGHEFSHFLKFLIRLNALNYKYGLYFSKKEYQYIDKPNEWKELAATYIDELRVIFDNLKIQHTYENSLKFLDTLLDYLNIPVNSKITKNDLKLFLKDFNNYFHKNDIENFIKTTYNNSKSVQSKRNNWKIFLKWIRNEFKRKYSITDTEIIQNASQEK